jgi:murein DD-endopeptidase MepM/ murein hydrolase activator NlpD
MSFPVPFCARVWPRIAILALVAVAAAGCSDSARFTSSRNEYYQPPRPPAVTGSVTRRPASSAHVVSQPLPAPSKPATVAAYRGGYANGAQGLGAYRPATPGGDITGSVPALAAAQPTGHWTWEGGKAVALARGETLASLGRRYHVPVSAIMQVNNIRNARDLKSGRRIVIPRWVSGGHERTAAALAPRAAQARAEVPRSNGHVYTARRGDTLIGIARRHGMSLSALARHNHISPFTKLSVGDRVNVPSDLRMQVASREPRRPAPPAPKIAPPHPQPVQTVASVPAETARVARSEPQQVAAQEVIKKAEPAGGIPQFRWPVKGRIIARFGREPNGTQNDGINLAVPEGTPIKAAEDGVVAYAGNELKGYGNLVLIRHANGYVSAYANASRLLVHRGEDVRRGQVIARAGQTGNVTSPQLHFEIRRGSTPVDPTKYLGG